jgi:hypothetical protein
MSARYPQMKLPWMELLHEKDIVLDRRYQRWSLAFAARAAEMTALPEGPNRDLVSKVCQGCHDLQMVFDAAGLAAASGTCRLKK